MSVITYDLEMRESRYGEWVRLSDYEALEVENENLKDQIVALNDHVDGLQHRLNSLDK